MTDINQCDGCRANAPLSARGNHIMPDGGYMGCTKDRYEALEREHLGDPDKRTGIYAPKVISDRCSHGKTWSEKCPDCELVSALQIEKHWGRAVDEARKVIAESEKEEVKT